MPVENLNSCQLTPWGSCNAWERRMVMNVCARQTLFKKKKKKKFYHGVNPAIFTKIATLICSWEISCLIASLSGD